MSRPAFPLHRSRPDDADEAGFTVVEVIVALSLFMLTAAALAVGSGGSMRMIGTSNGRQGATQAASAVMERLRPVPYDAVALDPTTVFEADPASPDSLVADGVVFNVPLENGGAEPLVLGGQVAHRETTRERGFVFETYTYVTWPTETRDHKRVTIITQWNGTDHHGVPNRVKLSSLFSPGSIAWSGTADVNGDGIVDADLDGDGIPDVDLNGDGVPDAEETVTAEPVLTDTTTTEDTSGPTCLVTTDLTPPAVDEFIITGGTGTLITHTASNVLDLKITLRDICLPITVQISTDHGTTWGSWEAYPGTYRVAVPAVEGEATVSMRAKDSNQNITARQDTTVRIDSTPPTTPGAFTAIPAAGNKADLSWTASTDPGGLEGFLAGYRIYRRLGSTGAYTVIKEISATGTGGGSCSSLACSWRDGSRSSGSVYTYFMTAYDAAGNESGATTSAHV